MVMSEEVSMEEMAVQPGVYTVECSVICEVKGFETETWSCKGSFCACDSASSSTVCSSMQADFSASLAADIHSEQSDVMVELLQILLNDDDGDNNSNAVCAGEHTAVKQADTFSCNSESEFWSWDDVWESNTGPVPNWEMDFSEIMDDWMLDAEMIALDGISDLETETTNPA